MFVPLLFTVIFFPPLFPLFLLTSFRQRQTIAFFPGLSTTLYSGKHSLLSLRTQQAHYIYIFFLECHSYRSETVNSPFKIQYRYSCRLMITHNGHSRPISFRFFCNFLDTLHSSTITVSSRLCHLQFCRNHQISSPDNKHGQDSATSPTSYQKAFIPTWAHILLRILKHDINAC